MKYYFAPLEGITGYIYRNAYERFFGGMDKYFTPFIVPTSSEKLTSRELRDVLPENNKVPFLVPQILTNDAEKFIFTTEKLMRFGYKEVNLNLGCPSGTVVAKGRGSGFLKKRKELDEFLEEVFSKSNAKISIKTRIGKDSPDEFYELIKIYNKYPLEELIIHPRIQTDFYNNKPNMKVFKDALALSKNRVCYNGDIFKVEDYKKLTEEFSNLNTVMLGRGIISKPNLLKNINNVHDSDKEVLKEFHDTIYKEYQSFLSGEKNVLFKMKEVWFYMIHSFKDSDKYFKKIRKANRLNEYELIVSRLFKEFDLI
ncbi:tRNA dihydrouridine synthase [Clostridium felsineum]|uniref:tRNA-dihydrouridine synthase n=1 Tax=Clostridium felsineum TaxID=36839 RepID=A0A1S8LHA9_9CLOT|nr:tRNA-dihydrouridine synthase [Clostridium felsineum]MCR3757501.1 tRNA-dihydrouridine synthase [Clostridium felsineum]URZ08577.1 tRNA-dihydrouridine(16) synthase [Clostridium felsineum]URZ13608.1 tRNA-dihydrouridine(16) synthase [Clostridium felsineum]URZ14431.1 tRNA-dihydrouridine(16) synthase [Clostridium felsineum DSM 794]